MKLLIKKFKALENLTIEIPAIVSGGNGLGKSTILEAISFCLTGKDLQGNEFKQVYDNRVDLHDAIANVSFFDNYGNEFQRIVKPIYSINRSGVEELKIKRSTQCLKNGIEVNDYSDDFSDFLKFGTDYFFNQKEELQRSIFIDLLKSKMPDYDVKTSSLKLKELKKAQKNAVDDVKSKNEQLKSVKDVEVSTIDPEIIKLNSEFLKLSEVDNSKLISEINKRNNELYENHQIKRRSIVYECQAIESNLLSEKSLLFSLKEKIKTIESSEFVPTPEISTVEVAEKVEKLKQSFSELEYFESIEKYAAKYFDKNHVLVSNAEKIKELSEMQFIAPEEISGACPLSGEICETAKLHAVSAEKLRFNNDILSQISDLKFKNREILTKEMHEINNKYTLAKLELTRYENELKEITARNENIRKNNDMLSRSFEQAKSDELSKLNVEKSELETKINELTKQLTEKQVQLSELVEPTFEKLPESLEISEELKQAHEIFEIESKKIIGQTAINENNVKLREQYANEIKQLQSNLFTLGEQITFLNAEISDYFSNLNNVVESEFSGEIDVDVELLEYVMSRDEWKDCFKITANGKVFPYECNGALQNNLKLQILSTLQRLKDYKGITLLDNAEANTTQPINTCGMNCILAFATNEKTLTIK
jgi:DNA repair exonuclease SbcCD ATPase subunit